MEPHSAGDSVHDTSADDFVMKVLVGNTNQSKMGEFMTMNSLWDYDVIMLSEILLPVGTPHIQLGRRHVLGQARCRETRSAAATLALDQGLWATVSYVDTQKYNHDDNTHTHEIV